MFVDAELSNFLQVWYIGFLLYGAFSIRFVDSLLKYKKERSGGGKSPPT